MTKVPKNEQNVIRTDRISCGAIGESANVCVCVQEFKNYCIFVFAQIWGEWDREKEIRQSFVWHPQRILYYFSCWFQIVEQDLMCVVVGDEQNQNHSINAERVFQKLFLRPSGES